MPTQNKNPNNTSTPPPKVTRKKDGGKEGKKEGTKEGKVEGRKERRVSLKFTDQYF